MYNKVKTARSNSSLPVNKVAHKAIISGEMSRENILKSFNQPIINKAWEALCINIAQNYQSGRGTTIKGFGVFTYVSPEVNLEGTTNQFSRDKKGIKPVFIVSKEFNEYLKPGQYNQNTGYLIYFTQKQNNSLSHVRLNYAEIAYSMGIKKEECTMIIQNIILYLDNAIRNKTFISKEMPHIGTLILQGNILGVKFNQEFSKNSDIPQHRKIIKKDIGLYMKPEEDKFVTYNDIQDVDKALKKLKPYTSVNTKITKGASDWLKKNLDLDIDKIMPDQSVNPYMDEYNEFNKNQNDDKLKNKNNNRYGYIEAAPKDRERDLKFINDKPIKIKERGKLSLMDLNIPSDILEAIEYHKSLIIREMKNFDKRMSGIISRDECARSFIKANVHFSINHQLALDICKVYANNPDNVDYMKLMTQLLRDIKKAIGSSKFNDNFDTKTRTFHNKGITSGYKIRPMSAKSTSSDYASKRIGDINIKKQDVDLSNVAKEMKSIKMILNLLQKNFETELDQLISVNELCNKLRQYGIVYSKSKIGEILTYIGIEDINQFSLREYIEKMNKCKILNKELCSEDIIAEFSKLKDIIYTLGGEQFFFEENKIMISMDEFISKIMSKTSFPYEVLYNIYIYLLKTERDFTKEDYKKYFIDDQRIMDDKFDENAIREILTRIESKKMKIDEYYSHLLSYNNIHTVNNISRYDFHKICLIEKYPYSAQEIDHIFDMIDLKKDNYIDRAEFNTVINRVSYPLYQVQNTIRRNRLDIDDIAFRLDIDKNTNKKLNFTQFEEKMKKLDYTFSYYFMKELFNEINTKSGNQNSEYIFTNDIINSFDVFHQEKFRDLNNGSFKENFISNIKSVTDYATLRKNFEDIDSLSNGRLTKAEFCSVIQKFSTDFKDEDIMRFTRISQLIDEHNLVKYPDFLLLCFYDSSNDTFNNCIECIKSYIINECKNDLKIFFQKLNHMEKHSYYDIKTTITIKQLHEFFDKYKIKGLNNNVVCKFDLDSDGIISYEDIQGILERYKSTNFFKFDNSSFTPDNNLYAYETMTETKFKSLVREIKKNMKKKNTTLVGLFNILDKNHDGFISNYEFNTGIDDYIQLSSSIKDQFFNYLDYYHNGLVDLETFKIRFKEFKSNEILVRNNNDIENKIIDEIFNYIKSNIKNISDVELFEIMDKDTDGLINFSDFKKFCIEDLSSNLDKKSFNDYQLQRIIQALSLTKNNNLGMADIRELIDKCTKESEFMNFKEKFKETINQNLYKGKQNTEWVNECIEKFALFISERYKNIEEFFELNTTKNSGKFTWEDFENFHAKNYECFEGFNLTRDEVLAIYTTLDSQKKNYLTLEDLKNKLEMFDFYIKMHFDIKNFIRENFDNSNDAFKFFTTQTNDDNMNKINKPLKSNFSFNDTFISKKNFFNTINKFFPGKYLTETILNYMRKNFKNIESISFPEFNWVYFDTVKKEENYLNNRFKTSKLRTERQRPNTAVKSTNNYYLSNFKNIKTNPQSPILQTPYDYDVLTKFKRLITSAGFDTKQFFNNMKSKSQAGKINKYVFRDMIKDLDLGFTHLEIEEIINQVCMTRDGWININDFIKFANTPIKILNQPNKNIKTFLSKLKQLIYKYYSTPKLAFSINDGNKNGVLDFNEYQSMICDLFRRETLKEPNFALIKNSFDFIDQRKNGVLELNEWIRTFSQVKSDLDIKETNEMKLQQLREWECSNNLEKIYNEINRNRKLLKDYAKMYMISDGSGRNIIQINNLIEVLKKILPRTELSRTQWKMMVRIADKQGTGMVDLDEFLKIMEQSARQMNQQPRFV